MTQNELQQLPVVCGVCLFTQDNDGVFRDVRGTDWTVGWLNGERVRQQLYGNAHAAS